MRDESYWTRKLMDYLVEKHKRDWLFYKLADHFTAGIPDVTIMAHGNTFWFELKVLKPGENMSDRIRKDALQFHDMCKIEEIGCPAWYLVFLPGDTLQYLAVRPSYIKDAVPQLAGTPLLTVHTNLKWVTILVETEHEH
jgi:hypothetical protein